MISMEREQLQTTSTPFPCYKPENSFFGHFWPFLTICACSEATAWSHLRFYWHDYYHWVLLQWYLHRESCSRLLTPHFSAISLKIQFLAIFGHFWPFFTICACSWATPWSHLRFYWHNYYHWVLLQWYVYRESCSRLLPPHFPAISLKIEFLVIFGHFSPFVPAHGRPHDPISAFINKNVITHPHNMTPAITTPFQN